MQPSSIRTSAIALCALAGLTTACEQNDFSQSAPLPNSEPSAASTRDMTVQDRAAAASTLPIHRPETIRPESSRSKSSRPESSRSEASRLAATLANLPTLGSRSALPLPRMQTNLPRFTPSLPPAPLLWRLPHQPAPAIARTPASPQTANPASRNSAAPSQASTPTAVANPSAAPAAAITTSPTSGTPTEQVADIQGHWSQPLVIALMNMGIVQGFADGNFRPEQPITQEQFLGMVQKAFPDEQVNPQTIPLRQGMTRAEAAKVVYQALADQGRIAPLSTLVATQNQPFNPANATASPLSPGGAIASQPSPATSVDGTKVDGTNPPVVQPEANLTATDASANAGSDNPINLEPVIQPSPQPADLPPELTVIPESTASPEPVAIPEPRTTPRPAANLESAALESAAQESANSAAVNIAIVGEVAHPGAYSLEAHTKPPTLIQAIQMAGGVTDKANVRQIEVHRGDTILPLDLWQLLQAGDLSKDMMLQPGDMISIPRAADLASANAVQPAPANLAQIQVSVVGEVKNPGRLKLPSNASVNQAILASGGFNRQTQQAELMRLNANGTIARRVLTVDLAQGRNESTNPRLRNNDVILIQPSERATARVITVPALIGILPTPAAQSSGVVKRIVR